MLWINSVLECEEATLCTLYHISLLATIIPSSATDNTIEPSSLVLVRLFSTVFLRVGVGVL